MKRILLNVVLAIAIITDFTACNNANETEKADKEKMHDGGNHKKDDGHQHDSTHKNDVDTMGMKIGGNELDTKKK